MAGASDLQSQQLLTYFLIMKRSLSILALGALSVIAFFTALEISRSRHPSVAASSKSPSWWSRLDFGAKRQPEMEAPGSRAQVSSATHVTATDFAGDIAAASARPSKPQRSAHADSDQPSSSASAPAETDTSRQLEVSQDQVTGVTYQTPAQAGPTIAEADVLDESDGAYAAGFDEAKLVPAAGESEITKLRWLEAVQVNGVDEGEVSALAQLMVAGQDEIVSQEIISSASLAETSSDLRTIIEAGLKNTQPLPVRIQALHVAMDHFPSLVQAMTKDADEDVRLQAESLLDPGRQGSEFRE